MSRTPDGPISQTGSHCWERNLEGCGMLHRKLDRDYITDGDGSGIYGGLQLGLGFLGQGGANLEKNAAGDPNPHVSHESSRTCAAVPLTPNPSPALGRGGPKSTELRQ